MAFTQTRLFQEFLRVADRHGRIMLITLTTPTTPWKLSQIDDQAALTRPVAAAVQRAFGSSAITSINDPRVESMELGEGWTRRDTRTGIFFERENAAGSVSQTLAYTYRDKAVILKGRVVGLINITEDTITRDRDGRIERKTVTEPR